MEFNAEVCTEANGLVLLIGLAGLTALMCADPGALSLTYCRAPFNLEDEYDEETNSDLALVRFSFHRACHCTERSRRKLGMEKPSRQKQGAERFLGGHQTKRKQSERALHIRSTRRRRKRRLRQQLRALHRHRPRRNTHNQ